MHFQARRASGHFQLSRNFCPSAWKKPLVRGSIPLLLGQFPAKGATKEQVRSTVDQRPHWLKIITQRLQKGPLARFTLLLFLALPFIRFIRPLPSPTKDATLFFPPRRAQPALLDVTSSSPYLYLRAIPPRKLNVLPVRCDSEFSREKKETCRTN